MTPRTEPIATVAGRRRRLRRPALVEVVAVLAVAAWVAVDLAIVLPR